MRGRKVGDFSRPFGLLKIGSFGALRSARALHIYAAN